MAIVKKPHNPGNDMFRKIMEAAKPEIRRALEEQSSTGVGQYVGKRNMIGRVEGFSLEFYQVKPAHWLAPGVNFNVVACAHIRVIGNRNGLPIWSQAPQLVAVDVMAMEWVEIAPDNPALLEKLRLLDTSKQELALQDQRMERLLNRKRESIASVLSDIGAKHGIDSGGRDDY